MLLENSRDKLILLVFISAMIFNVLYFLIRKDNIKVVPTYLPISYGVKENKTLMSEISVKNRFEERRKILQNRCLGLNDTKYLDLFLKERFLYQADHDFFICLVAKVNNSHYLMESHPGVFKHSKF